MLLLAVILAGPLPPKPPADYDAMERTLKAALPEGWRFVSWRAAEFGGHYAQTCWLATLEATKTGDYYLVAGMDHDVKAFPTWGAHTVCRYHLGVGVAGTRRSVADPYALPQCNVGDRLVVPVPVRPGDTGHRFTFTRVERPMRRHILGYEAAARVTEQAEMKPAYKVDNKAARHLRIVAGTGTSFSQNRAGLAPFHRSHVVTLEAASPGRLTVQAPVEVLVKDAKVTAWVGIWDQSRLRERPAEGVVPGKKSGGTHGFNFAGPLVWTMRVGDRIRVTFPAGTADKVDTPLPDLTIPGGLFVAPREPYPSWR